VTTSLPKSLWINDIEPRSAVVRCCRLRWYTADAHTQCSGATRVLSPQAATWGVSPAVGSSERSPV